MKMVQGFPAGSVVKIHLPAQETQDRSLGWEDPLEEEMATHSSSLAWKKSHEQRSLVGYSPWGHKESDRTEHVWARKWFRTVNILINSQKLF